MAASKDIAFFWHAKLDDETRGGSIPIGRIIIIRAVNGCEEHIEHKVIAFLRQTFAHYQNKDLTFGVPNIAVYNDTLYVSDTVYQQRTSDYEIGKHYTFDVVDETEVPIDALGAELYIEPDARIVSITPSPVDMVAMYLDMLQLLLTGPSSDG